MAAYRGGTSEFHVLRGLIPPGDVTLTSFVGRFACLWHHFVLGTRQTLGDGWQIIARSTCKILHVK